ncbi:Tat pathway signal sequence domain protein 16 [Achromobacter xylosoxidans A8]|uniref:Tat pathway signal sequence domain protein 16 n=1 Tax=Achromobacter xylosoxidans (strain A8) TaxID=762376 RepID=E3HEQ3_ACHXA|nr:FecR domain-containing protein [Achromobacter xylosoxidans]ADP16462.1 Tat pathway signal sequence domain protein 16 [Achromobacter xylosoxidans A8]
MQQAPDEALIDQALTLIATAEIATERGARQAVSRLTAWRARTPQHEAAYVEAMRRWQLLAAVAPDMRARFDQDIATASDRRLSRRALLGWAAAGACTAALGAGWYWRRPLYQASYETGSSQLSQAQVPDQPDGGGLGTRIDLAARTRLAVSLYRDERVVELSHGEALFTVARDASRPFRVRTRGGEVEVVGTVFTVSDRGGVVSLAVEEGHVRFRPAPRDARWYTWARGGPPLDLYANTAVSWRNGEVDPVRRIDPDSIAAWRNGWLWFDNQRLDEALPAINAFRAQPLTAADPKVSALRLTGRFRSADAGDAAALLEAILPLRAESQANGDVVLRLR